MIRFALAIIAGLVAGSLVNMGLVLLGGWVVPPPPGAEVSTLPGLKAALPQFEPKHFVFPFLAHAAGTLAGACVATLLAPVRSSAPAFSVGGLFLLGGVVNVVMLSGPAWFTALDLLLAYLPCAWLGRALARSLAGPTRCRVCARVRKHWA